MKAKLAVLVFVATLLCLPPPAHATTRTWTGGGTDNNWMTAGNWGGSAPVAGDDLVFPAVNLRLTNTNNFAANTVFRSITFTGTNYVIRGNAITNNAGITNNSPAGTTNTFSCAVTLGADQTFSCATNTTLIFNTNLVGNLKTFTLSSLGTTIFNGLLSSGGFFFKTGDGTLVLASSNSYGSLITVVLGRMVVRNSSALGLTVQQTTVDNGTSLELDNNISVPEPIAIGTATLRNISGTNTLTGTNSFTVGNSTYLVETNSQLTLSNVLNSVGGFTKTGPGVLVLSGNVNNTYSSATFVNEGTLVLNKSAGTNAVTAAGLTIGDSVGGLEADVVRLSASNQIPDTANVTINSSGLLDLNGKDETIARLTMDGGKVTTGSGTLTLRSNVIHAVSLATVDSSILGNLSLGGATRTFTVNTNSSLTGMTIPASINDGGASAGLIKAGAGTLRLSGTNTYTGGTVISNGTLFVNGLQPGSAVSLNGGTLGGSGTVGTITSVTGGTVSPGAGTPGILTCSNVVWNSNTTFAVKLNGLTVGSQYDRLVVNGTVDLNNASLVFSSTFKPAIGSSSFVIILNNGTNPVAGTFAGLPNGSTVRFGGLECLVFYDGGDGNDVVLSPLNNFALWDGGAGPANTNWSNATNWLGDALPASGDSVLFPPAAPGLTNFNDFTNGFFLRTVRIEGSGYNILGTNRLEIWNFAAFNTNGEVSFTPTLRALVNPLRFTNGVGGTLNVNCSIQHTGAAVELGPSGTMVLNAPLDGFQKTGPGVLRLPFANPIPPSPAQVFILQGTVQMSNDFALGGAVVQVYADAQLELAGGRTVSNNVVCQGVLAASGDGSSNRFTGFVTFSGTNVSANVASNVVLTLAGTTQAAFATDPMAKNGPGQLFLAGAVDTLSDELTVNQGTLFINAPQPEADAIVNAGGTLGGNSTQLLNLSGLTNNAGVVAPGAGPNTPGQLLVGSATFQNGSVFRVRVDGATVGTGYSQLRVSGPVVLNTPTLELQRTFTPSVGSSLVILSNTTANAIGGAFAGLPEGTIFNDNGVSFQISYAGGSGNDVVLTLVTNVSGITRTWSGAGTNSLWMNGANWVGNLAPGTNDALVFPAGAAGAVNTNDFPAEMSFASITISSNGYSLWGNSLRLVAGIHATIPSGTADLNLPLTLSQAQTFSVDAGTLLYFATVNNGGNTLTLNDNGGTNWFNNGGVISGAGGLVKNGLGTLRFSGTGTNIYTGTTTVNAGTVELGKDPGASIAGNLVIGDGSGGAGADVVRLLNGNQIADNSQIAMGSSGLLDLGAFSDSVGPVSGSGAINIGNSLFSSLTTTSTFSGSISGVGTLAKGGTGEWLLSGSNSLSGNTSIIGGILRVDGTLSASRVIVLGAGRLQGLGSVGEIEFNGAGGVVAPGASPGLLTSSNFNVGVAGTGTFEVELNGTVPGVSYDQLSVHGTVDLSGLTLAATLNFASLQSNQFIIIANDGTADPVTGTFNGKAEGAIFSIGTEQFRISYVGGDGNDVVLTQVSGPPLPLPVIPISSGPYTQDFNTLAISGPANTWSNSTTLGGWYAAQSLSPFAITSYRASDGSDVTGALYSFGSSGNGERALGSLASGTPGTIGFGLCFTNDTPLSVSNFRISYTGEQWRNGSTSVTNTLSFWYRVSASAITNPEPATTAGWTEVTSLDFASPTVLASGTALNGNQSTNQQKFVAVSVPGLVLPPGQNVFFRWLDPNDTSNDDGMAVDDLLVSFPTPAPRFTSISSNPTNGFAQFTGLGLSSLTYGIEAASNLNSPIFWQLIGSNTANGSGVFSFTDTNAPTFPMRFYRAVSP